MLLKRLERLQNEFKGKSSKLFALLKINFTLVKEQIINLQVKKHNNIPKHKNTKPAYSS